MIFYTIFAPRKLKYRTYQKIFIQYRIIPFLMCGKWVIFQEKFLLKCVSTNPSSVSSKTDERTLGPPFCRIEVKACTLTTWIVKYKNTWSAQRALHRLIAPAPDKSVFTDCCGYLSVARILQSHFRAGSFSWWLSMVFIFALLTGLSRRHSAVRKFFIIRL